MQLFNKLIRAAWFEVSFTWDVGTKYYFNREAVKNDEIWFKLPVYLILSYKVDVIKPWNNTLFIAFELGFIRTLIIFF